MWLSITLDPQALIFWTFLNVNFALITSSTHLKVYSNNFHITRLQQLHFNHQIFKTWIGSLVDALKELGRSQCLWDKIRLSKSLEKHALGLLLYLAWKPWNSKSYSWKKQNQKTNSTQISIDREYILRLVNLDGLS